MLKSSRVPAIAAAAVLVFSGSAGAAELAINGGFETGDFSGWDQFPSGGTTQSIITVNPSSGIYAANMNIPVGAGAVNNVLKNSNLGAGTLVSGETLSVSFDIRGSLGPGGVLFAENFSEVSGGGVSFNDLRNITVTDDWTTIMYDTVLGPDVSGGFTLQFAAVCGAVTDCSADIYIDNVSIQSASQVPVPAALWLFGSALGLLGFGRRRAA